MALPVSVVHVNDIFDKTVIEKRMEYAFGTDGTDFWKRFFLCGDRHSEDKILYLFTQSQLKTMRTWLINKERTLNDEGKKILNLSKQFFFNDFVAGKPKVKYGFYPKRFSFIKYDGITPHITDTFRFSSSDADRENNKKNSYDFFDGGFIDGLKDISMLGSKRDDILKELLKLKKEISEKILKPRRKKWLRYLGEKNFPADHPDIEYCADIEPKCDLVAKIFASSP
jgi:hypothetical protein